MDEGKESPGKDSSENKSHNENILADGEYDVIILGTNVQQTIIGCMLLAEGYTVLFVDENSFYGGSCASVRPCDLRKLSGSEGSSDLGNEHGYSIDIAPKLLLSRGALIDLMIKTKVSDYMEFKNVDGSFAYKHPSKVYKVPVTSVEAAKTPLVTMMQKRKLRMFFKTYLEKEKDAEAVEETKSQTASEMFEAAELTKETQGFLAHTMALFPNDNYRSEPALKTLKALRLYADSVAAYGKSPFIYPTWGIGTIAEAFARKCAVQGATFMLHTPVDACTGNSVTSQGKMATARLVISDPLYAKVMNPNPLNGMSPVVILRSILVLNKKPKCITGNSAQIIIPQNQVGRVNDIYMTFFTDYHKVCPKGYWVCIISSVKETDSNDELDIAINLLDRESILERFNVENFAFLGLNDLENVEVLLTESADATSAFESTMLDVNRVFDAAMQRLSPQKQG